MSCKVAAPVVIDGAMYPEEDPRWITVATMAQYLGVCTWTVWQMTVRGEFPTTGLRTVGTRVRYQPATIYRLKGWGRYARVNPESAVTA